MWHKHGVILSLTSTRIQILIETSKNYFEAQWFDITTSASQPSSSSSCTVEASPETVSEKLDRLSLK